jgi:hypothetical protein
MDRRQLAGRAMNDQVHVRLIALEFKNSANNQLLGELTCGDPELSAEEPLT